MNDMTVCTIVARNYLPAARVLANSVRRQHPQVDFVVLLLDDRAEEWADGDEPFRVVRLHHIGLGGTLGTQMAGIYTLVEFATAVKPWLIEHLLRSTGNPVLYLDPDCEVYAPLDSLAELAEEHSIAVTPHTLQPFPRDGRLPDEAAILSAGIYNLGFIGVAASALTNGFLGFWQDRLRRHAVVDPSNMLFTDQRWIDFITCFPHAVVRDSTCNVAYWNVWGRELGRDGDTVTVDGAPLRFFHYSGFRPRAPHILSVHQGQSPRVLLSEHPILAAMCRSYAARLIEAGYDRHRQIPYGWDHPDIGMALDATIRSAWRTELLQADISGQDPPPGPFDPDGGVAFTRWARQSASPTGVSRYVHALWLQHPDLQGAFPNCLENHRSAAALADWTWTVVDPRAIEARERLGGCRSLVRRPGESDPTFLPGLNIYGYLRAQLGVGEAGRLVLGAAATGGLGTSPQSSLVGPKSRSSEPGFGEGDWAYDTNVFCVNADELGANLATLPPDALHHRRSAGVWFWETEQFPEVWWPAFDMVDEVWAPSQFIAGALERTGRGQVRHLPIPFPIPAWSSTVTRADLGLPDGFLVFFTFDWNSVRERKNPDGLIEAFCRAFEPQDGAHLVIKSINGHEYISQLEQLRLSVGRPDIHIIDGPWRWWQMKAALEGCDCYASLHRSEGLGLAMGEAMALAKPVVASAWSGNLDFMDESTAHLVPVTLVPIPPATPVYGGFGRWAEPDLDAAAAALRRVHDDPVGAQALGARARAHLVEHRSLERTGRVLTALSDELRFRPRLAA